jgi:Cof subfamily protein (haloacid dehalogenase superfamily)
MRAIEQHLIPRELVGPIVSLVDSSGLDAWLYRGAEWYVRRLDAPHVAREAQTVRFEPTVVDSFEQLGDAVAKIVGVSDDLERVAETASAADERFGEHISAARSQPYYLDVTHPQANKGSVAQYLSRTLQIAPEQIATIGDQPNDVLMFAHSGLSIAMGNADREVQRAARRVTASNDEEGFAVAVERLVLPRARRH